MKKIFLYIGFAIIIAVLSYELQSFELILFGIIVLCILGIAITGIIHIFKRPNKNIYKFFVISIGICLIGIMVSLFRPYEAAILQTGSVNEKLEYAYHTDQNDRKQLKSFVEYFSKLKERDDIRLNEINKILREHQDIDPLQKFYAAFIYHHSDNSKDYETASTLAAAAASDESLKNSYQVQWLKKASYDRWMLSIGKPEKYNTQNKFSLEVE